MAKEMRDLNRIREDLEFRLNGTELKLAVAGLCAICLLIFVVGFFVGRHFPSGIFDRKASVDARAPDAVVSEPLPGETTVPVKEFTFYEELKKGAQDPIPAAADTADAAPVGTDRSVAMESEQAAEMTPAAVRGAAPTPAPAPKADPAPATTEAAAKEAGAQMYTVQVAAFEEPEAAENLSSHLREKGYRAYTMAKRLPGRGTWYRVRVDRFDNRSEAEAMAARLEMQENLNTFITPYSR